MGTQTPIDTRKVLTGISTTPLKENLDQKTHQNSAFIQPKTVYRKDVTILTHEKRQTYNYII